VGGSGSDDDDDDDSSSADSSNNIVTTTIDKSTGIAYVQLNRPKKLNALNVAMMRSVVDAAERIELEIKEKKEAIRAVILSGNGRAFCTGLDVKSVLLPNKSNNYNPMSTLEDLLKRPSTHSANLVQDLAYRFRQLPVPVVAVLHGMCYGGGLQCALGADFRIAVSDCKLSIMETKWGLIPDMAITLTLRELMPIDVAKELTMTGRIVSGREAQQLGLVTKVVDANDDTDDCHAKAMEEAIELALRIADRSPDAVALSKRLYQETWHEPDERRCLELETRYQRRLIASWNQVAASARTVTGWKNAIPYRRVDVKNSEGKNSDGDS